MSSQAQILANQANAQLSTGPRTETGKANSSKNNIRHGLTGPFMILGWENKEDYQQLKSDLFAEHQPATLTEEMLVEDMAQSHWLRRRAITLQTLCFHDDAPTAEEPKELALYIRYQTTHERAFYKALNQLLKLRADKRRSEIGFASQQRKAAEEARRSANEVRKQAHEKRREAEEIRRQEMHNARIWLTEAQAERHDTEAKIAELVKMPRAMQTNQDSSAEKAA